MLCFEALFVSHVSVAKPCHRLQYVGVCLMMMVESFFLQQQLLRSTIGLLQLFYLDNSWAAWSKNIGIQSANRSFLCSSTAEDWCQQIYKGNPLFMLLIIFFYRDNDLLLMKALYTKSSSIPTIGEPQPWWCSYADFTSTLDNLLFMFIHLFKYLEHSYIPHVKLS